LEVSDQLHDTVALPSEEGVPDIHWLGGWEGLRSGLDAVAKKKNHFTAPAGNRIPVVQPLA